MTTPASPSEVTTTDITPPAVLVHKVVVRPDYVGSILAAIDPQAPAGRMASQVNTLVDSKTGGLTFVIHYAPAANS
jgi:hypothetical protein